MTITNGQLDSRACLHCSKSYNPTRPWQKTCSYLCSYSYRNAKKKRGITNNGACGRCGVSLADKRANAIYCSKTCKSMDHTFKHRARTRTPGVSRRMEIYKRDSGKCYICQKSLLITEMELDHLVPVARSGDSSSSNLAASCQFCNRSRGTTIGIDQLRKLFELRAKI